MKNANPPRLMEGAEFGNALRAVAAEGLSPERLARNGERIARSIATLPTPGPVPAAGVGSGLKAGVSAALLLAAVGGLVVWQNDVIETPEQMADIVVTPAVSAADTADASIEFGVDAPVVAEAPAPAPTRVAVAVVPAATPEPSELAAQMEAYQEAVALAKAGDHQGALAGLDAITTEWPQTPLAAEIALSRADYLVRLDRNQDAIAAFTALIEDPQHAGRRAELHRVLGDLWLKEGNCDNAVDAYKTVIALEGPFNDSVAAGMARCNVEVPASKP